eukprot:TRINITY_DN7170_c0_g1_i1.p1 TRINITY_DN7170_c0_g1~~TRINITY_DN7170_c0_g1_i1.p1  ORF type:complete len:216 (-),score=32.49 TRINITY_DN7170_c0_g1_i1:15-662(-)
MIAALNFGFAGELEQPTILRVTQPLGMIISIGTVMPLPIVVSVIARLHMLQYREFVDLLQEKEKSSSTASLTPYVAFHGQIRRALDSSCHDFLPLLVPPVVLLGTSTIFFFQAFVSYENWGVAFWTVFFFLAGSVILLPLAFVTAAEQRSLRQTAFALAHSRLGLHDGSRAALYLQMEAAQRGFHLAGISVTFTVVAILAYSMVSLMSVLIVRVF